MKPILSIAYLTTTYPAVSHTFIRRELLEIERRGHKVTRLALRKSKISLVDPSDLEEERKTFYFMSQPLFVHIAAVLGTLIMHPISFFRALALTVKTGRLSDRSWFRHIAYFIEACTFFHILRKNSVQHIHVHFGTNAAAVARLISRISVQTYSFTVHGPAEFDAAIGFDLSGKIQDSLFVVAISYFCSAQLRRWTSPKDWDKIKIIRCTVGNDFFNSDQPIDEANKTFVCVGRLAPQKGQLILIDAFASLLDTGIKANLILVGDGDLRNEIEKRILKYNIKERVKITGFVSESEVRRYISLSRALVLPSFAEGLPMVIMESFALGRPVVSTYIAAIPELVFPGKTGWLVPAANVDELRKTMETVLDTHPDQLHEMAMKGREVTLNNHYTQTEVNRLEKLFIQEISGEHA
jgi:glycosyltransferase involved in cell wall biosynthesis